MVSIFVCSRDLPKNMGKSFSYITIINKKHHDANQRQQTTDEKLVSNKLLCSWYTWHAVVQSKCIHTQTSTNKTKQRPQQILLSIVPKARQCDQNAGYEGSKAEGRDGSQTSDFFRNELERNLRPATGSTEM